MRFIMSARKSILIALIIATFCLPLVAHNYLLDQDKNGFFLDASYKGLSSLNMHTFSPGYIFNGRLTLNANLGVAYKPYNESNDKNAIYYSRADLATLTGINIDYLVIKQNIAKSPINLSLSAHYNYGLELYKLPSVVISDQSHDFGVGANISHIIQFDPTLALIPFAGIQYEYSHAIPSNYIRLGASPIYNNIIYSLKGTLVFNRIYAFMNFDYVTSTNIATSNSVFYRTTDIGIGFILPK